MSETLAAAIADAKVHVARLNTDLTQLAALAIREDESRRDVPTTLRGMADEIDNRTYHESPGDRERMIQVAEILRDAAQRVDDLGAGEGGGQ